MSLYAKKIARKLARKAARKAAGRSISKSIRKPVLKRSLLGYAVAVAVGGFGQQAFAADLCLGTANIISTASAATDNCILNLGGVPLESLTVTGTGTLGVGFTGAPTVIVNGAAVGTVISNAGLIAGQYTAIDYDTIGLGGSLTNTGTITTGGLATARAIFLGEEGITGTLTNSSTGVINAVAFNATTTAQAQSLYADGSDIFSDSLDLDGSVSGTRFTGTDAYVALSATGSVTNDGTLNASAQSNNASWGGWAVATGMAMNGAVQGAISNAGTISADAYRPNGYNAQAYALRINGGTISDYDNSNGSATAGEVTSTIYAYDDNQAFVGLDDAATLTNTGTISAEAEGQHYNVAYALFIDGAVQGDITNGGTITADANSTVWHEAYARGLNLAAGDINHQTGNGTSSNDVTGAATSSTGLDIWANTWSTVGLDTAATLANTGSIAANAYVGYQVARAYGLTSEGTVLGDITNSGNITASAQANRDNAYAYAVEIGGGWVGGNSQTNRDSSSAIAGASSSATSDNSFASADDNAYIGLGVDALLSNSGTITAVADVASWSNAGAYGIIVNGTTLGDISNTGGITAAATANQSNVSAQAISLGGGYSAGQTYTQADTSNTTSSASTNTSATTSTWDFDYDWANTGLGADAVLTNSGTLAAWADAGNYNAYATGISANQTVLGDISNSGTISAVAGADISNAYAEGVRLDGGSSRSYGAGYSDNYTDSSTVTNTATTITTGTLTVTGTTDSTDYTTYDDRAWVGLGAGASLVNSGTINVVANASNSNAYATGISVDDAALGVITNSGTVNAYAEAYNWVGALGLQVGSDGTTSSGYSSSNSDDYTGSSSVGSSVTTTPGQTITASTNVGNWSASFADTWADDEAEIALGMDAPLTNSGTLSAVAVANGYSAQASALIIDDAAQSAISNSGSILAAAEADDQASALGFRVGGGWIESGTDSNSGNSGGSNNDSTTVTDTTTTISTGTLTVTTGADTSYSDYANAYTDDWAYVGLDSTASWTNTATGTVTAVADANDSNAWATAVDIQDAILGAVTNSGSIIAAANAGWNYAGADALILGHGDISSDVTSNTGNSSDSTTGSRTTNLVATDNGAGLVTNLDTASGTAAYAFASAFASTYADDFAHIGLGSAAPLTNSGSIVAAASADGTYWADARALVLDGAALSAIDNSGSITASADVANAYGNYAWALGLQVRSGAILSSSNSGSGTESGTESGSFGNGVNIGSENWNVEENINTATAGTTITTTVTTTDSNYAATGADTDVYAYADDYADTGLGSNAQFTNGGSITAAADVYQNAYATGVNIDGAVLANVTNSGSITASADAAAGSYGGYNAYADGLRLGGGTVASSSGAGSSSSNSSETITTGSLETVTETVTAAQTTTLVVSSMTEAGTDAGDGQSANTTAEAWSYIGLGLGTILSNSGSVSAVADAQVSNARASALNIDGAVLGALGNSGSISAAAEVGSNYAYADAMVLEGGTIYSQSGSDSSSYTNSGTFSYGGTINSSATTVGALDSSTSTQTSTVTTSDAWTYDSENAYADDSAQISLGSDAPLTNSGSISATAIAGNYYADARALVIDDVAQAAITNTGSISALADVGTGLGDGSSAYALGLRLDAGSLVSTSNSASTSYGGNSTDAYDVVQTLQTATPTQTTVTLATTDDEAGVYASGDADDYAWIGLDSTASLTNAVGATISATAKVGDYYAGATALDINGASLGNITNAGSITASAEAGYGSAYADGLRLGSGSINSSTSSFDTAWDNSYSYGGTDTGSILTSTWNWTVDEQSTSATVDASTWSSIGLGAGTVLANSGTISALAIAENSSSAGADALHIDGAVLGSISNTGTISASATTGDSYADAVALTLHSGNIGNSSSSEISTSVSAEEGTEAILVSGTASWTDTWNNDYVSAWSDVGLGANVSLANSGSISASAVAGGWSADATAVEIEGVVLGAISNSGSIAASAEAGKDYYAGNAVAYGVRLEGGTVVNNDSYSTSGSESGTETTTSGYTRTTTDTTYAYDSADDYAYMALAAGATLTNSGSISATALLIQGDDAAAYALEVNAAIQGTVNNSGSITAQATSDDQAYATGVSLGGGSVNSYGGSGSGSSSESSTGISTNASQSTWMTDQAYVSLGTTGVFTNTGTVSATATAAGYNAYATALETGGALLGVFTNSGALAASATTGNSYARATGVDLDDGWLHTENGSMVDGDEVYTWNQAYVGLGGAAVFTNDGTITAFAEADSYVADASGMNVSGVVYGALTNNGEITATAVAAYNNADASGLDLSGGYAASGNQDGSTSNYIGLAGTGVLTNTGAISAFAEAGSNSAWAQGIAIDGDDLAGVVLNSGTVRAFADAGEDDAYAYGLSVGGNLSGTITNSNAIAANANADDETAYARALSVNGDVSGTITNSDSLGAFAGANDSAYAYGLAIDGDLTGTVNNSGTIDVAAEGGSGYASAQGVTVDGGMDGTGSLSNTGYVGVRASSNGYQADAYGLRVSGSMHDTASVSNAANAVINVRATADDSQSVYGVDLGVLFDSARFTNAGTVSVQANAVGTTYDAAAVYGVHTDGLYDMAQVVNSGGISVIQSSYGSALVRGLDVGGIHNAASLLNSGAIDVVSVGEVGDVSATALAIAGGYDGATMTNSGAITVAVTGGGIVDVLAGTSLFADVQAVGISLDSQMVDSTLTNTGVINVTATGDSGGLGGTLGALLGTDSLGALGASASAYGIKAGLVEGASVLSNSSSITANAAGGDSNAYGIYARGLTAGAVLLNTGSIDANAGPDGVAYGVFVDGGVGVGSTAGFVINSGSISDSVFLDGDINLDNAGSITNTIDSYVGGNYSQGVGGSLAFTVVDVDTYGQLTVDGTADFSASNDVRVLIDANDNLASGDVLVDVISAGTLTASAFDVTDNTLFWNFTPVIDGNTLDLIANYRTAAEVFAGHLNVSGSMSDLFDRMVADGADGPYADFVAMLDAAPDAAAAAAIAARLNPVLDGAVAQATRVSTGGVFSSIDSRLAETSGAASGDAFSNSGIWIKGSIGTAEQNDVDGVKGYDADSSTLVIGVDGEVSDAWRTGLAVGTVKTDADNTSSQVDIRSTLFVLYGSYAVSANTALDLALGFGKHDYDASRAAVVGIANSTYDGDSLSFGANLSRTFKISETKAFVPSIGLQYVQNSVDAYSETGAGIYNLQSAAVDETSVSITAKGKYEWTLANTGVIAAHLGLGVDTADGAAATATLNSGSPNPYVLSTTGIQPEDLLMTAGVGYRYVTSKNLEIEAGYDLEARQDFMAGVAALKFKMPF